MDWRDNEATQQWLDGETWVYTRSFTVDPLLLGSTQAHLICEGLDTLATVSLNGREILEADNMFRTWRTDAGTSLRPGTNIIEIRFHSTLPKIAEGQQKRPLREWNIYFDRHQGRGYVRKMACSYGWDWGPVAPTAGIWKNIRLEFRKGPSWSDVRIRQHHSPGHVLLEIAWETEGEGLIHFEISRKGQVIAKTTADSRMRKASLPVPNPELWWPTDLGQQPLYDFSAHLTDPEGTGDTWKCRLGLRTIRLVREQDAGGQSFVFEVNGKPIFCKGSNWVPHRILLPEITRADYARLLQDTVDSHMNMLRVWGGGIYENDAFYELCDELGILVWQDFTFACGVYPTWDLSFLASVKEEAQDNIRRLRHHPSLALWCGNNELEMGMVPHQDYTWEEYGALFDRLLPQLCEQLDPDRPYWPSSPHTPVADRKECNDQRSGDAHLWGVFFGHETFESQRKWTCRFMSEYGFQSFPELRTLESFTDPEDRNLSACMVDYHQRSEAGNRTILSYQIDWFQTAQDLETTLILTQLTQALCVRYAAEHLRRLQPHCSGVLYWQINDIWPCASWSSIDSFGRWKSLQYDAKRFFAPILVSIEEDLFSKKARIHLSNQLAGEASVIVRWEITDTDGTLLVEGTSSEKMASQEGRWIADLEASPFLEKYHAHDLMVWAWASVEGQVVSRNWAPLARPKHLSLADPGLTAKAISTPTGMEIHLSCKKPAPYVRLSLGNHDALFSDNFFHLHPREPRVIEILRPHLIEDLQDQLTVKSLADSMTIRGGSTLLERKPKGYDLQRKR